MKFRSNVNKLIGATLLAAIVLLPVVPRAVGSTADVIDPVLAVFDELVSPAASGDANRAQKEIVTEVVDKVRDQYVEITPDVNLKTNAIRGMRESGIGSGTGDPAKLAEAALAAMLTSLDPHSSYLNAEKFQEMQIGTRGSFGGLGIQVSMENGLVKVISPIDDTPAFHAGVRAGDLVTHIDGTSVLGLTLAEAVSKMRGLVDTRIILTIRRDDQPSFDIPIIRATIKIQAVRSRLEGDIGYLRISAFSGTAAPDMKKAIASFWANRGNSLKGIVLDLRNNPGGLLSQAVAVAGSFLEQGTVVSTKGRVNSGDRSFAADHGDLAEGLPIVVMVNGGSASASEIVAGALQDYRRATVFGTKSFGKGSVQTIFPIKAGGALRLTTALYHTPLGRSIQAMGISPDVVVEQATEGKTTRQQKREEDLKGALPSTGRNIAVGGVKVNVDTCPPAGGKKDRQLDCALAFLGSGGLNAFLSALNEPNVSAPSLQQAVLSGASKFPTEPVPVTFRQVRTNPDDIAVIIGNANYGRFGNDIPNVTPAYADAESIKRYATQALGIKEGNIIHLKDATGSQMDRVFGTKDDHKGQVFDWTRPGQSRVFVYYAGHGAPSARDGSAYLVPSDADGARIHLNGYPLSTLYRNLSRVPAKSITVVLEACFSGNSESGSLISNASPVFKTKKAVAPANITVIAAGGANQIASWEKDKSHGLFTKYFLKGMSGEADVSPYGNGDGTVAYAELGAYLENTLTYYARRHYGRDQTVQITVGKNQ